MVTGPISGKSWWANCVKVHSTVSSPPADAPCAATGGEVVSLSTAPWAFVTTTRQANAVGTRTDVVPTTCTAACSGVVSSNVTL